MKYAVAAQRAWVINKKQELLMVQYIDAPGNSRYKGTWGLPGGKVDLGDSLDDSLIKEVLEETGIRISPRRAIGLVGFTTPFIDQKQIMSVIRLAEIVGGKLLGERQENHSRLCSAWIPLSQVASLKLAFDEAAEIIRLVNSRQLMQ